MGVSVCAWAEDRIANKKTMTTNDLRLCLARLMVQPFSFTPSSFLPHPFILSLSKDAGEDEGGGESKILCRTRRKIQEQAVGVGNRMLADFTAVDIFLCDMSENTRR